MLPGPLLYIYLHNHLYLSQYFFVHHSVNSVARQQNLSDSISPGYKAKIITVIQPGLVQFHFAWVLKLYTHFMVILHCSFGVHNVSA